MEKLGYSVEAEAWVFPSRKLTLKQPSSLINAIRSSAKEVGVTGHVTPHRMRYAFNLLRLAGVDQVTRRRLIGHVTEEMQDHYSTVLLDEKRVAMEQVAAKLAEVQGRGEEVGDDRGYTPQKPKAA